MKKALTVSIVIPVYNEQDYLKACLDAIAAQTLKPKQVIVVDNNSTDDSAKIAKHYSFVRIITETRQGVDFARDAGFNAVTADIIGRIDADTIIPPGWVERVVAMFTKEPDMAAVSGPTGFHDLPLAGLTLWMTKVARTSLFYIGNRDSKYLFGSNMAVRTNSWHLVANEMCHVTRVHEDNDLAIHLDRRGLAVHYSNKLINNISVRRANDTPRQAVHYAFSEYYTYRYHGIFSIHAWLAGIILLAVYPGFKWAYRAYDPQARRFSWKRWRQPPVARPHPMG